MITRMIARMITSNEIVVTKIHKSSHKNVRAEVGRSIQIGVQW